jgi:hypothetical protein
MNNQHASSLESEILLMSNGFLSSYRDAVSLEKVTDCLVTDLPLNNNSSLAPVIQVNEHTTRHRAVLMLVD